MAMLGFLRPKCVRQEDPSVVEARRRQEIRRSETEKALNEERGDLRNKMQVIQSQSRRFTAMANAMALTRENVSG